MVESIELTRWSQHTELRAFQPQGTAWRNVRRPKSSTELEKEGGGCGWETRQESGSRKLLILGQRPWVYPPQAGLAKNTWIFIFIFPGVSHLPVGGSHPQHDSHRCLPPGLHVPHVIHIHDVSGLVCVTTGCGRRDRCCATPEIRL